MVSFLAVSIVLFIAWKLSGFITKERVIKRAIWDGGQRCNAVLQQLKSLKTHSKDKVSAKDSLTPNKTFLYPVGTSSKLLSTLRVMN